MTLLQEFNINELAGATGLMLGALDGLLAVIWKSRSRRARSIDDFSLRFSFSHSCFDLNYEMGDTGGRYYWFWHLPGNISISQVAAPMPPGLSWSSPTCCARRKYM
eukprot:COSAG05_NODE_549_length_8747_cov_8.305851_2_plen_106_part_00